MRRMPAIALTGSMLFLLAVEAGSTVSANSSVTDTGRPEIEVKLSVQKRSIRVGESLEVRVEIWNVGDATIFIKNDIYNPCAPSPLSITLIGRSPLKGAGFGCASDCFDDPKEDFTKVLVRRWTVLPRGNFYGAIIHLHPDFFPQLRTPGRWLLKGQYASDGLSSSACINHIPVDPDKAGNLPYKAWEGRVDTNSVWLDVVRPRR